MILDEYSSVHLFQVLCYKTSDEPICNHIIITLKQPIMYCKNCNKEYQLRPVPIMEKNVLTDFNHKHKIIYIGCITIRELRDIVDRHCGICGEK